MSGSSPFPARVLRSCRLAIAMLAVGLGAPSLADDDAPYPSRMVTIVTPFAAGSGPDAIARLFGEKLSKLWNQRVLIENKTGGNGLIAMDLVRRTAPDGYTLLQLDSQHLAAIPHLYAQRGVKPLEQFDPVVTMFNTPFLVAVPSASTIGSITDLWAHARAAGDRPILYGSWGIGSPGHLGAIMLAEEGKVRMEHVAYREVGPMFVGLGNGDIEWSFASVASSRGAFQAGKIRYVAIAATKRIALFPQVPTVAEAGGPKDFALDSFAVLVTPRGAPAAVHRKLRADVTRVLADPEVQARLDAFAFEPIAWGDAEIRAAASRKSLIYEGLIRRNRISLE